MGNETSSTYQSEVTGLKYLEQIGQGSYRKVYKAEWKGELVAAKQLHKHIFMYVQDQLSAEMLYTECEMLRGLNHPNIVKMIDLLVPGGKIPPIFITELLHCDLRQYIKDHNSAIPLADVTTIMLDVAKGLQYLHERPLPIAHRNLSSKNVLLTENRTAKIANLGVARVLVGKAVALPVPGAMLYAAPETFHHRSKVSGLFINPVYDVRVDVFSFGVLLLEVIIGHYPKPVPWNPVTENGELIHEHQRRKNDLMMMGKEHRLSELVFQCLENNTEARPTAKEMVHKLNDHKEKIDRKVTIASSGRAKLKIVALGGIAAGKTCILERFVNSKFNYAMVIPTIGSSIYTTTITHNGITFGLQMDDTAGQERFDSIPPILLRDLDAALLVFDVSNRKSFAKIPPCIQTIVCHSRYEVSMILVGNKIDMSTSRKVLTEEAQAFAKTYGMPYIETSAKTGENINRLFELAVQMVYDRLDLSDIDIYFPVEDPVTKPTNCNC